MYFCVIQNNRIMLKISEKSFTIPALVHRTIQQHCTVVRAALSSVTGFDCYYVMRKILAAIIFFLAPVPFAMAQDYVIEAQPDKDVIYVDRLNLPDYLYIEEVLQMLPEFAVRGDQLYKNFDFQLDGKSVGEGYYTILTQTKLGEIEKIEISTSSVATQQKSEVSGTVNLIPRKQEEGFGGEAFLNVSTDAGVMPSVDLNYRKDKLQVYGNASVSGSWTGSSVYSVENAGNLNTVTEQLKYQNYFQETARVNLVYNITDRDEIKGWLLESWKNVNEMEMDDKLKSWDMSVKMGPGWYYCENVLDTVAGGNKQFLAHVMAQYKHTFGNDSKFTAFAGYEASPDERGKEYTRPHTFDGDLKYESAKICGNGFDISLEGGANVSFKKVKTEESRGKNLYLSPYAKAKYRGEKWSVDAALRYQHFERELSVLVDEPRRSGDNNLVGDINAVWQFHPHRALRMYVARNLLRPGDYMLYPRMYYSPVKDKWIKGNRDLTPAYMHSVGVNYIFDRKWSGNSLFFDFGLDYTRADDLIEETIREVESNSAIDPVTVYYTTFMNSGIDNILTARLSTIYTRGIFTLALAANLFTKNSKGSDVSDTNTYFNISLNPILNLKRNWTVTGKFIYNSPVVQNTVIYGDCFLAELRLGKRIKDWTIHAEISDIFDYLTTDFVKTPDRTATFKYDLYGRYVGIGVSYRFGNPNLCSMARMRRG